MVVAFYFRLHLAYFPRPVVAIFARPEQNKTGICSACKKKAGDTGVTVMGVLALIGGAIWTGVKAFTKKD